jgi:hypothetical protein
MDWGFQISEGTIYLNPSNFGEVTTLSGGVAEGGFFYIIEMEERLVSKIIFKKLVEDRVYDIADYNPQDNGYWKETIVDPERYKALKQGDNFDLKTEKYSHIPEVDSTMRLNNFTACSRRKKQKNA